VLAQVGDARRGAHAQSRRRRGSDPPPRVYRVSPDARTATTVGGAAGPHCLRQTGELCRGAARRRAAVHVRARKADGAPSAVGQATTRLRKNVNYFKVNYLIWILTVLTVCMLANPQSLFVLSGALVRAPPAFGTYSNGPTTGIAASWAYLFVARGDAPLVIAGRPISEREKLLGASGVSVAVIFFLTSVGSVLFSAVCIGLAGA